MAKIPPIANIRSLLPKGVSYYGPLDSLSHDDFIALIERHGGRYVRYAHHAAFSLLVLGEGDLPVTSAGDLVNFDARSVIAEGAFLAALGEAPQSDDEDAADHSFTLPALAELLKVRESRLLAWAKAGLLSPRRADQGIPRFDFRQAAVARTLVNLTEFGVSIEKIRRSIGELRRWLPDLDAPLHQLSLLEHNGPLLVRLESGDLAEVDGQIRLDFDASMHRMAQSLPLFSNLMPRLRNAQDWHEQGIAQEQAGQLAAAIESYREALLAGGPDAQICFDLAHVLAESGQTEHAIERYRQVTEIEPARGDAWNNLGVLLSSAGEGAAALAAFRRAARATPSDADIIYNLADALSDAQERLEAARYFRQYLGLSPSDSPYSRHARGVLK